MEKKLLVKKQGKFIPQFSRKIPTSGIISIGNDASATIELADEQIAPEQIVIVCEETQITLLCRAENTQINGKPMPPGALHNLELEDIIGIGDYSISVETAETADKLLSEEPSEISADEQKSEIEEAEKSETPDQKIEDKNSDEKSFAPEQSLSDVLAELRAEEKFYFLIEDKGGQERRVYVETEEMFLGWSASGECVISSNRADIETLRAQIRKDWSGVVLHPKKSKSVWLEKQILTEPRRLKNDDQLFLAAKDKTVPDEQTVVKFHEPTALLVLDSILPKELPPPVSLDKQNGRQDEIHESRLLDGTRKSQTGKTQTATAQTDTAKIFGYFSIVEILIMIAGIIAAAAVIFLVLEFS